MAKHRKEHYFVKCRVHGYQCQICGGSGPDLEVLKALDCSGREPEPEKSSSDAMTAHQLQLEELKALEVEGLQLELLMEQEMINLYEMELEAERQNLARFHNLEKERLAAAKVASLEAQRDAPKRVFKEPEPLERKVPKVAPEAPERRLCMEPEVVATAALARGPAESSGAPECICA